MVCSPVTGKANVVLEEVISVDEIIERYKHTFDIDVSKYFPSIEKIEIYKCLDSNYRFYYPFNLSGDGEFYKHFQQYDWYYVPWKWEHETVKNLLKPKDHVLEIGCGFGSFIKKLETSGISCVGLELNEDAVRIDMNYKK